MFGLASAELVLGEPLSASRWPVSRWRVIGSRLAYIVGGDHNRSFDDGYPPRNPEDPVLKVKQSCEWPAVECPVTVAAVTQAVAPSDSIQS